MLPSNLLFTVILSVIATTDAQLVKRPYSSYATDMSNTLRHLGGTGPFVEATAFGIPTETPEQCIIDQAHLFMRHGERYPTKGTNKSMRKLYEKLKNSTVTPSGPLAFINDYEYFVDSNNLPEQESFMGAYAGTGDAFYLGNILRARYSDLIDTDKTLPIFSSSQKRVYDTAVAFAEAFTFGEYVQDYQMVVLPETEESGVNSLTNTKACPNFDGDYEGPLVNMSLSYKAIEAERLNRLSPGLNITEEDVFNMCNFCGFETDAIGFSKFCDAVTFETLIGFGYEKDIHSYYSNGPGYNMSYVSGSAYINATATLLADNETESNLYFSFSHDNDLLRLVTSLGVFDIDEPLPVDRIDFYKFFSASEIIPMGGRLITERMSCYNATSDSNDSYVRLLLNDQVLPYPGCSSGPGYSCPLDTYLEIVANHTLDFVSDCNMNTSLPQYVSFYWDWKTNNYADTYEA